MATLYPTTLKELEKCQGVSAGKAMKFGKPFVNVIEKYVEENEIEKPDDFVMKSVVNKNSNKVFIIQNVDKKMPLETIAKHKTLKRVLRIRPVLSMIDVIDNLQQRIHIAGPICLLN